MENVRNNVKPEQVFVEAVKNVRMGFAPNDFAYLIPYVRKATNILPVGIITQIGKSLYEFTVALCNKKKTFHYAALFDCYKIYSHFAAWIMVESLFRGQKYRETLNALVKTIKGSLFIPNLFRETLEQSGFIEAFNNYISGCGLISQNELENFEAGMDQLSISIFTDEKERDGLLILAKTKIDHSLPIPPKQYPDWVKKMSDDPNTNNAKQPLFKLVLELATQLRHERITSRLKDKLNFKSKQLDDQLSNVKIPKIHFKRSNAPENEKTPLFYDIPTIIYNPKKEALYFLGKNWDGKLIRGYANELPFPPLMNEDLIDALKNIKSDMIINQSDTHFETLKKGLEESFNSEFFICYMLGQEGLLDKICETLDSQNPGQQGTLQTLASILVGFDDKLTACTHNKIVRFLQKCDNIDTNYLLRKQITQLQEQSTQQQGQIDQLENTVSSLMELLAQKGLIGRKDVTNITNGKPPNDFNNGDSGNKFTVFKK